MKLLQTAVLSSIFVFSGGANAAIQSLDSVFGTDTITRDTATGLDWLDVTQTRGLSYNQVLGRISESGDLTGWRYATVAEFEQLIQHFGYTAINDCNSQYLTYCDQTGESETVETIIRTLGDTYDAWADEHGASTDASPDGAGYTFGMYGDYPGNPGNLSAASGIIYDLELVPRNGSPAFGSNRADKVYTFYNAWSRDASDGTVGSFLVAPTVVPVPAAVWLFGSALLGLGAIKRKKS